MARKEKRDKERQKEKENIGPKGAAMAFIIEWTFSSNEGKLLLGRSGK